MPGGGGRGDGASSGTARRKDLPRAIAAYGKAFELDPENYPGLADELEDLRSELAKRGGSR